MPAPHMHRLGVHGRRLATWSAIGSGSALAAWALHALKVPGAFLLGPMLVGIAFAVAGVQARIPGTAMLLVQAVLGCLIASAVNDVLLATVRQHWLLFIALSIASIVLAAAIGHGVQRLGWLPGSTAVWGLAPGAATTMILLSEGSGADPRIVALMQYLRVLLVALSTVALAGLVGERSAPSAAGALPPAGAALGLQGSGQLLGLLALGVLAAYLCRKPVLALLVPTFAGGALQGAHVAAFHVPQLLAAAAFGVAGCAVGLRFTRALLVQCGRRMPVFLLAIAALMAGCALLSCVLALVLAQANPLTAYLAMTPGGLDMAVAVGASLQVSLPIVIAAQLVRLVVVMAAGPCIVRRVARWG